MTPRNPINNKFVYQGEIYHIRDMVRLPSNSYIPRKYASYDPVKQIYLERSRGFVENALMLKSGKLIPVYLSTYFNTYNIKLGLNSFSANPIFKYIIKILYPSFRLNSQSIDYTLYNKCLDFINSFPSHEKARKFLYNVSSEDYGNRAFINENIDYIKIYIPKGERLPSFFVMRDQMLYIKGNVYNPSLEPLSHFWNKTNNSFPYNISAYKKNIKNNIEESFNYIKIPKTNMFIRKGAYLIGSKYTLGIEIESSSGVLSYDDLVRVKSLPLTDGSLRREDKYSPETVYTPLEIATLVLRGNRDIIKVIEGYRKVLKNINYDNKASLHVHFGNYPLENDFIIAFYNLCYKIQDELFSCFPLYKSDYKIIPDLNKNYCQKLDGLNLSNSFLYKSKTQETFNSRLKVLTNRLFNLYSEGHDLCPSYNIGNAIKGVVAHPKGASKWNHKERYKWNNLMNYFFNPSRTLELRISPMTHSPEKIMAICLLQYSLIEYASINRVNLISNKFCQVTLDNVFDVIPDRYVSKVMKRYFKSRKEKSYIEDPYGHNESKIKCQIEDVDMILREK